jgi:heptosyltransferase-2
LRKINYANVYNLQRYASTGFITWFIKADLKIGYSSNPISFAYDRKIKHDLESGKHEVERNFELIDEEIESNCKHPLKPKLYPSEEDKLVVSNLTQHFGDFVVMAPASVWFTKQLPLKKWVEIIQNQSANVKICLIGAPSDEHLINQIINDAGTENCVNLAGKLSLLQSAALIGRAKRTFVNDSAPLHLASAMNAPVIAFFCSTVPAFGFGPLSDDSKIAEVEEKLSCRPCGLHGYKACPKGHFDCGAKIALPFN